MKTLNEIVRTLMYSKVVKLVPSDMALMMAEKINEDKRIETALSFRVLAFTKKQEKTKYSPMSGATGFEVLFATGDTGKEGYVWGVFYFEQNNETKENVNAELRIVESDLLTYLKNNAKNEVTLDSSIR